ncbi:MAG: polysaccharide deacetylase family protein [Bacilli bacterium]|nr:polysaccharide deacetylase family protein [Bacilli bacterium]MDD3305128.1 polysaccharide deacetylase family protein [Bacilli bacterium]MDD4054128.1 polysaccharide deacetylase family protein [Bacilli bacterium]MDD4411187.1 polysaccharide deacetylase family protein [Bacilli bacterium]
MKLKRKESLKYKKAIKVKFIRKIIKNIAIGTIAISIPILINSCYINESEPVLTPHEEVAVVSNDNENKEIVAVEIVLNDVEKKEDLPVVEIVPPIKEPTREEDELPIEVINPPIKEETIPNPTPVEETNEVKQQEKRMVALSYDDGPSKTLTPELLEILKDNDCTATFFVLGNRVKQYSDIIYEVYSAGNEIGNHSFDHSNFANLSESEIKEQLNSTNEAIYEVTNEYPTFFRPPYGSTTEKVKEAADCPIALWSIDSNDWRKISDEDVINNVILSLEDGKIILMHDIHERTIEVSKILIPKIKELGYDIVSIKELYEAKGIELEDGSVYSKAKKN